MTTPTQIAASEGYWHRVAVALDQAANVICGGRPDETLSSRWARSAARGNWFARRAIAVLDWIQPHHDVLAREADLGRAEIVERIEERSL